MYVGSGNSTLMLEVQYDGGGELTAYNLTSSDNLTRDNESDDSNTNQHTDIDATLDTTHTETLGAGGILPASAWEGPVTSVLTTIRNCGWEICDRDTKLPARHMILVGAHR